MLYLLFNTYLPTGLSSHFKAVEKFNLKLALDFGRHTALGLLICSK